MTQTGTKLQPELAPDADLRDISLTGEDSEESRDRQVDRLRLLWGNRRQVLRATAIGFLAFTLMAFLIPKTYTSTAQLMPPDAQSVSGMAMMAAFAARGSSPLGSVASDLLGLKSSGALFVGVLRSESAQDHLVQKFDLRKVYGRRLVSDARMTLDGNTLITEDRKSGIISISVTDRSPQRAAALANAYVEELNSLVVDLSTSSAHRERVFLEERLRVAKLELDDATNALAQFSSKNSTLDIQEEGKAMLDAASTVAGEMIVAQSQLEGLRQIYTDNNSRVRSLNARVAELRKQVEKLGGTQENQAGGTAGESKDVAALASEKSGNMPFPTIRNLPLLGAKYSDYYRRAKIQETVFELLTEQYELAKVEEAKETPSVKVLDPGTIPERKSFPPRLLIMTLGTFLVCAVSVVWVSASARWQGVDTQDPRKVLLNEVAGTLRAQMPWAPQNNGEPRNGAQRIWARLRHRKADADDTVER